LEGKAVKINNIKAGKIEQYYNQLKQNQKKTVEGSKNDQIKISSQAKGILTAKAELKNRPQVRTEKVEELKAKRKFNQAFERRKRTLPKTFCGS